MKCITLFLILLVSCSSAETRIVEKVSDNELPKSVELIETCVDEQKENYFERSVTVVTDSTGKTSTQKDECISTTQLKKYYCENNQIVYKTKDCTELQSICLQGTCVQTPKQPGKPEQIQTGNADVKDKTQLSSRKELVMPITVKQTLVWNEFYIGEKKHVFSETPVVSQWIVEVATKNISILPDSTIIQQRGRLTRNLGLDFGKNELKYYSCDKTENKIKCSWYKTEFTVLPSCMDLDDGDNERVTGSIGGMKENGELQIQPVSDNCIDKKTLREYFCEEKGGLSYISSKEVLCENFCRNGACVDK